MAIEINGSGTIAGISSGGINDDVVDAGTIAANSRMVLEQFWSPCDGSVIALQDGNHTITDVTAKQEAPGSWTDCSGSSITYTPPSGTTQVIYEYRVYHGYVDQNVLSHFKLLVDTAEVTSGRHNLMRYDYPGAYESIKWGFNIGGTADPAVGRLDSWTSNKTIKVQWKRYASSQEGSLHQLKYWDQSSVDLVVKPQLSITAIG